MSVSRDYGKEIDELRKEISLIKAGQLESVPPEDNYEAFQQFYELNDEELQERKEYMESKGKKLPEWGAELAKAAIGKNYRDGIITVGGIYQSPADEGHMWSLDYSIKDLLEIDESVIEKVLAAMGHRVRIRLIKSILMRPSTAAELVEQLDLKTTGKAYHHLNMMESADLIHKDSSGKYHLRGHRVSGFFAALVSVADTINDQYSVGDLDKLPANGMLE